MAPSWQAHAATTTAPGGSRAATAHFADVRRWAALARDIGAVEYVNRLNRVIST